MKLWITLIIYSVLYAPLFAQPSNVTFVVHGSVSDAKTNEMLEYVNVVLYRANDSSLATGTITQPDGTFKIELKRPGKFYLTADFIGYNKTIISDILLKPGQNAFNAGNIKLNPSRLGIDAVEVVAEKPFVTYQLDKKVIDVSLNPSAQGGTAVDALENTPSIQTDMEGNVTLRGSSSFTVLIDGRQSPLTGTDALNQVPASAIDKIEIITNPSVKYDPDGTAGIINIISKKGKLQGHSLVVNASAGTSPMYSGDLNYSYRKENITFTGGLSLRDNQRTFYNTSDQFINKTNPGTEEINSVVNLYKYAVGNGMFGSYSIKGGVDYKIMEGNVMNMMLSYNNFNFERESETQISNYYKTLYQQNRLSKDKFKTNPKNWQVNIGDKHIFNKNQDHYISIDAMYRNGSGKESNSVQSRLSDMDWNITGQDTVDQQSRIDKTNQNLRLELNYMQPLGNSFILEAGYTLRVDEENQEYSYFTRDPDSPVWSKFPGSDDESFYQRNINAGWALFKGQVVGLNLSGGLRLEHTNRHVETEKENYEFNYNYLGYYPSLAISKEFKKGDVLQFSYSKRINRPRPWHLSPFPRLSDGYTQYDPNPELEPEYTSSLELNFQKSLRGISFLALETFYHHTKNKIERLDLINSDTLTVYTMDNLKSDKRVGAELGGHIKINKWLSFMPGLSAYYYEADGDIYDEYKKVSDITTDIRLTTNFILPTKTRIQLMGFYRGAEVELSEEQDEMYWFSGAVRQELLNRKLTLTFRVDDIFSTRKRIETAYTENTVLYSEGYRKSPTFVFSVSYRLNQSEKRNGEYNQRSGENGGGMDMDF